MPSQCKLNQSFISVYRLMSPQILSQSLNLKGLYTIHLDFLVSTKSLRIMIHYLIPHSADILRQKGDNVSPCRTKPSNPFTRLVSQKCPNGAEISLVAEEIGLFGAVAPEL